MTFKSLLTLLAVSTAIVGALTLLIMVPLPHLGGGHLDRTFAFRLGFVLGQAAALACWTVLVPRLPPLGRFFGFALGACQCAAIDAWDKGDFQAGLHLVSYTLFWLGWALLVGVLFRWNGWKFTHRDTQPESSSTGTGQFGLQHLFVITGVAAIGSLVIRDGYRLLADAYAWMYLFMLAGWLILLAVTALPGLPILVGVGLSIERIVVTVIWTSITVAIACASTIADGPYYVGMATAYMGALLALRIAGWQMQRSLA